MRVLGELPAPGVDHVGRLVGEHLAGLAQDALVVGVEADGLLELVEVVQGHGRSGYLGCPVGQ